MSQADNQIQISDQEELSELDRLMLTELFVRPVCSETIFLLVSLLKLSSPRAIQQIFELYLEHLYESAADKTAKPPEMRVSQGIYLCIILRFKPNLLGLYIKKQHYIIAGWKAFYPYINMFIIYFLIPCIVAGANIEEDLREATLSIQSVVTRTDTQEGNLRKSIDNRPVEPIRSSFPNYNSLTMAQMNALRDRVGSPPIYQSNTNGNMTNGEGSPPLQMPVITKLIESCNLNSPERKSLAELRRTHTSGPNFFFSRLGLKTQKTELAIFLDIPSLLDDPLTEDDIQKAIFMHSNKTLKTDGIFLPHHFDRSVSCLNYEMAKHTFDMADWIRPETLDELIFLSKELKHAICLELLLLIVQKNISLCQHHLKRLPVSWRERILKTYTTPRWKSIKLTEKPPQKEVQSNGEGVEINATLEFYKMNLGFRGSYQALLKVLEEMTTTLQEENAVKEFLEKTRVANQSYYILDVSGYTDFFSGRRLTFANPQDLMGNNVFDVPRNFVFPYRVGELIYLFDYSSFETITKTKLNPYTRTPIAPDALEEMLDRFQRFNLLGLSSCCLSMDEFIKEMINGRVVEQNCPCGSNKNYVKKLARALRSYSVKVESFDVVNLQDALFKLSLMSFDFTANSIPQLCSTLYKAIKMAEGKEREQLKQAIASVILLYSRYSGGNYIVGF